MDKRVPVAFYRKPVVSLNCNYCSNILCTRGMKAILLADTNVELYSTDLPPPNSIAPIGDCYKTGKCECKIKDIACIHCGNLVGYHVVLPCTPCLTACNNGHLWMFYNHTVICKLRTVNEGSGTPLLWGNLATVGDSCTSLPSDDEELLR